tara:strand:- start:1020 stop:3290 length:2271 start_codon:yes stop_codon:yes gene_type:complete
MKIVLKIIFFISLFFKPIYAEDISILAAYGTSYSDNSSYVTNLINKNLDSLDETIYWEPDAKDNGMNEGIYFQFDKLLTVDEINLTYKNLNGAVKLYLDGKEIILHHSSKSKQLGEIVTYNLLEPQSGTPVARSYRFKSIFIKLNHKVNVKAKLYGIEFKKSKIVHNINSPLSLPVSISATSTLEPIQAYNISNIADSKLDMAWSSDGKKSNGIGEQINIELETEKQINGLMIWNGYHRSESHFLANNRIKQLTINDQKVKLDDSQKMQKIIFEKPIKSTQLRITIDAIYPGEKYQDTLISELRLIGENNIILPIIKNIKVDSHPQINNIVDRSYSALSLTNQQKVKSYSSSFGKEVLSNYISLESPLFPGQIKDSNRPLGVKYKMCPKHDMNIFQKYIFSGYCYITEIPKYCYQNKDVNNEIKDKNNNTYPDCMEDSPDSNKNQIPDIFEDPDYFSNEVLAEITGMGEALFPYQNTSVNNIINESLISYYGSLIQFYLSNDEYINITFPFEYPLPLTTLYNRNCKFDSSTLKLRSNGSFVLYDKSDKKASIVNYISDFDGYYTYNDYIEKGKPSIGSCEASFPATIMEGNWESLSDSKIRIFGKKYDADIQPEKPDSYYSYIQDFNVQKTKPQIFQSFVNIKQYNELSETEKNKIIHLMYQPNPQTPFHYAHISHKGVKGIPSCKANSTLLELMSQYACINTGVHFFSDTKKGLYSKLNKFFTSVNPIYFESNIYTTLFFPSNQINERFTSAFVE